ncbi:MAG: 50S ribosomal protein L9 [Clostridia bacterium]|nr:50S ribosomal protein L9 [Clostridia bacterium]
MKVVLNQDVKGLGKKLQVVEVSEGYARNFLLPKKLAVVADNKNLSEAQGKISSQKFKKQTELEKANEIKAILEKGYIEFKHKVGEGSKLYGSVTEKDIAEKIKEKFNIEVNKKKISISDPIKNLGSYTVNVKLYEGVIAKLKISVVGM